MRWGDQQQAALRDCGAWLDHCRAEMRRGKPLSRPIYRLFGYAGVGKTTLARHLAGTTSHTVFAAFTGKAALMMQRNGCVGASTIHGLIYVVEEGRGGTARFRLDKSSAAATAELIVIDECSMVDEEIGEDLLSYGRPILVLGDPAQLPPVRGAGFFTNHPPDFILTEIHRQAAENPIIYMATELRNKRRLKLGGYGESRVIERGTLSGAEVLEADQVLVGKNATRRNYNNRLRRLRGFQDDMPEVGDRLVCLRNDKNLGIFNGGLFLVADYADSGNDQRHISIEVTSEDFARRAAVNVKIRREFFNGVPEDIPWQELKGTQQFDFGYALTVHKAQGSQWQDVIVYDESGMFEDEWWRWSYTAATRAAERLTMVV
jgi:exodeoxyribonuclease-5